MSRLRVFALVMIGTVAPLLFARYPSLFFLTSLMFALGAALALGAHWFFNKDRDT